MPSTVDRNDLHRTAKYFMDNGRADSPEAAVGLLRTFGLTIHVGVEVAHSKPHQDALLTLVNTARRTLLAGVEIIGLPSVDCISRLAPQRSLGDAVRELGGMLVATPNVAWPSAIIGTVGCIDSPTPCWQLTWEGWRGGVVPHRDHARLSEQGGGPLAPPVAAAACAAEAFAYHAGDHPMAGRRASGISMWNPGCDWRQTDVGEPDLAFLPSRLWLIGLGNLGQAILWLLGCLPYDSTEPPQIVLQDFDSITRSNESTSLLTSEHDLHRKKARLAADWLDNRGFHTVIEERRFGTWTQRSAQEPGVALCGVDNALARASLEKAGFGLIVEAGLGGGPQGFHNIFLHTFPASRSAEAIWSNDGSTGSLPDVREMPAYQTLRRLGMDQCGVTQLASRTVAVPFVGVIAASLVVAELLRRLHGGKAIEVASLSVLSMDDIETVTMRGGPYAFGHVPVTRTCEPRHATPALDAFNPPLERRGDSVELAGA